MHAASSKQPLIALSCSLVSLCNALSLLSAHQFPPVCGAWANDTCAAARKCLLWQLHVVSAVNSCLGGSALLELSKRALTEKYPSRWHACPPFHRAVQRLPVAVYCLPNQQGQTNFKGCNTGLLPTLHVASATLPGLCCW